MADSKRGDVSDRSKNGDRLIVKLRQWLSDGGFQIAIPHHDQNDDVLRTAQYYVNTRGKQGMTPLHLSAEAGDKELVVLFLKAGADVNRKMRGKRTPLHLSAVNGHKDIVKILINAGADVNRETENKRTPLHISAERGHKEIVEILLSAGADVNKEYNNKWTSLHISAQNGHYEIVEILLKAGANIDAENKEKETALHLSSKNDHLKVSKLLTLASKNKDSCGLCALDYTSSREEETGNNAQCAANFSRIDNKKHSATANVKSTKSQVQTTTEIGNSGTFQPFERQIKAEDTTDKNDDRSVNSSTHHASGTSEETSLGSGILGAASTSGALPGYDSNGCETLSQRNKIKKTTMPPTNKNTTKRKINIQRAGMVSSNCKGNAYKQRKIVKDDDSKTRDPDSEIGDPDSEIGDPVSEIGDPDSEIGDPDSEREIMIVKKDIKAMKHDIMAMKQDIMTVKQEILTEKQEILTAKQEILTLKRRS